MWVFRWVAVAALVAAVGSCASCDGNATESSCGASPYLNLPHGHRVALSGCAGGVEGLTDSGPEAVLRVGQHATLRDPYVHITLCHANPASLCTRGNVRPAA